MKLHVVFAAIVVLCTFSSGKEISFWMWNKQPSTQKKINCPEGNYIYIIDVSQTWGSELNDEEIMKQHERCNCKQRCRPKTISRRLRWTLIIEYDCSDTCFICEDNKATITCSENSETTLNITSANYGRTADNICRHPSKPSGNTDCEAFEATFEKVKDDCQERVECELHANSKRFSDTCSGTFKYLEVNFDCRIYETQQASSKTTPHSITTSTILTTTSPTSSPRTTSATTTPTTATSTRTSSSTTGATTSDTTSSVIKTTFSTRPNNSNTQKKSSSIGGLMTLSSTQYSIPPTTGGSNTSETLNSESDASRSSITAIAVSVSVSVVAISAAIFILVFRRWRRKSVDDAVYKNGTTIARKNKGDGFTNMIYSKETDDVILQDNRQQYADTNSNSGDSGYTDMHNEDTREVENNDYYMIKENMVPECAEKVDNQYYAIKDNVGSEYNKITFKPKDIPDDPSYGHTLRSGIFNTMDVTYDHAEGSSTLMHIQLQEEANNYSHLNQNSSNGVPKVKHTAFVHQDQVKSKTNEIDGALAGHEYFILEESQNKNQADSAGSACHNYFVLENDQPHADDLRTSRDSSDEGSHDYFVLSKEGTADNTAGSNSVLQPKDGDDNAKQNTQPGICRNDLNDHTYFENPLSSELDNDTHQYQVMGQRISTDEPEISENVNHDYFILQQENA